MEQAARSPRLAAAHDTMEIVHDISTLLNTGLSREQLRACVDLIEAGTSAEAVAASVQALRKEAADLASAPSQNK